MNLTEAKEGEEYIIKEILTDDEELTSFLFSLQIRCKGRDSVPESEDVNQFVYEVPISFRTHNDVESA